MNRAIERLQKGSLRQVPRAYGQWAWEWRYVDPTTGVVKSRTFSGKEFPTLHKIEAHLETFIDRLNGTTTENVAVDPTIGDLLDKYIAEEIYSK